VIRTRVGYAGGTKNHPTYYNLGDHSESIQIDYDAAVISYGELLKVFWANHDPTYPTHSRQYASLILYHNEEQRQLAQAQKLQVELDSGRTVHTQILPLGEFTLAQDYHQKYYLQSRRALLKELTAYYPSLWDLVDSTVAARLNGLAGGHVSPDQLAAELPSYGLSKEGQERATQLAQ